MEGLCTAPSPPPPQAGSEKIYSKTTVRCSPGSSLDFSLIHLYLNPSGQIVIRVVAGGRAGGGGGLLYANGVFTESGCWGSLLGQQMSTIHNLDLWVSISSFAKYEYVVAKPNGI